MPTVTSPAPGDDDGLSGLIRRFFRKFRERASAYTSDADKAVELGNVASDKADKHKKRLGDIWEDLQTMLRLVKAWGAGHCRRIRIDTILRITAALLYLVSPIDAIPDVIPVLGLTDDIAVLSMVIASLRREIDDFRAWEDERSA